MRHIGRVASLGVVLLVLAVRPLGADVNRWSRTGPRGGRITLVRVHPVTPSTIYAVADGTPYRSTDGGASWSERSTGLPVARTGSGMTQLVIDAANPSILNAITAESVFRSTNGGGTWTRSDPGVLFSTLAQLAADPSTPGRLYLIVGWGQIYRSTDSGATWAPLGQPPGPTGAFPSLVGFAVDPFQPSSFHAAMFDGGVTKFFVSTNAASTWTERDAGLPVAATVFPLVVAPTNPPTLYLAYPAGLFRSRDRGLTWSQAGLGRTDLVLYTVDPSSPTTLYASSDTDYPLAGNLLRSTDDGATWTQLDIHVPRFVVPELTAFAVAPTHPGRLYAGTTLDGVIASADGGATWTLGERGLSSHNLFNQVLLDPGSATTYVLSWRAAIWKSTDAGDTWMPRNPEPAPPATGETFTAAMDPAAPQTLYLGSSLGGVWKSVDAAETWTPANTALTDLRVSAVAVDPQAPGTVFAATPGGLFRSTDGAGTWTLHNAIGTLTALAVDPVLPGRLYGNDGALTSADGGASFAASGFLPPQAPDEIARGVRPLALAPAAPATAYVGVERVFYDPPTVTTIDTLFKSVDGLGTATAVASGRIDAVEVDPSEPNAVWAAFHSRPSRSRNGAAHFDPVVAGLPLDLGDANVAWAQRFGVHPTGSPVFLTTTGLGVFRIELPPCAGDAECDDGDPCTSDVCTAARCDHAKVSDYTACSGRDVCAFTGVCLGGQCGPNTALCDDGDGCTADYCLTSGDCEHVYRCIGTTSTTTSSSTTTTTLACPPSAPDTDRDGVCDQNDDCPDDFDPFQRNIDHDALGDVCDPHDADLSLGRVRLRTGAGTGTITLKGRFVVGPGEAFDAATGLALAVADGLGASVTRSWPIGECETRRTSVVCRSTDGVARTRVSADRSTPGGYKLTGKLRGLPLAGPLAAPVTATLTQSGAQIDRVGTIAACSPKPTGLDCSALQAERCGQYRNVKLRTGHQ